MSTVVKKGEEVPMPVDPDEVFRMTGIGASSCACIDIDAWRCAVTQGLSSLACNCKCHKGFGLYQENEPQPEGMPMKNYLELTAHLDGHDPVSTRVELTPIDRNGVWHTQMIALHLRLRELIAAEGIDLGAALGNSTGFSGRSRCSICCQTDLP